MMFRDSRNGIHRNQLIDLNRNQKFVSTLPRERYDNVNAKGAISEGITRIANRFGTLSFSFIANHREGAMLEGE